jgi:hypothetical protein
MNAGYGSLLTEIIIKDDSTLIKKAKSKYGIYRISQEMNFYKNIINNNINFSIPKIYLYNDFFEMEYLKNYITCEEYLNKYPQKLNFIIDKINNDLNILHKNTINISFEKFINDLKLETYQKIKNRLKEIEHIITKYNYIKTVNNKKIFDIVHILTYIETYIETYIKNNKELKYSVIHGDIQLNNILIDIESNDIKYIDPRGFFGNTSLYGLKEYDYAKLYFGLGGYSYFDFKHVDKLNINENNINIDIKNHLNYDYNNLNIINIFIICIWLGNAHCFINNEFKMIESYFYALYIASCFIEKN